MTDNPNEIIRNRSEFDLPFGRNINIKTIEYESGLHMLRLTIREGRRFTILDIDKNSAKLLGNDLLNWATK